MKISDLNIVWEKCIHGVEKRNPMGCQKCREEQKKYSDLFWGALPDTDKRIPITRGCTAHGPCFCDGSCKEIIGYRDPLFPGEK